ncbi:Uncharacterized protein FWK35_00026397 [Aphis craccivora]|uniref:Uncharacterized protein n=1 Tax=Aphis craccivora TaxID=307492 RepID=A0A6G0VY34_APHCR|nr:Uncharacterized protein FWK35_00026397 [Aphis craccivora]
MSDNDDSEDCCRKDSYGDDNVISQRVLDKILCPLCHYKAESNKLTRHIGLKHKRSIRKPVKESLSSIGKIFGKESRRSVSLVPMKIIRE